MESLFELLSHMKVADQLNTTTRQLNFDDRPETVSEHTLGMLYIFNATRHKLPKHIKQMEVVSEILVHDFPEAITKDIVNKTEAQKIEEYRVGLELFSGLPLLISSFIDYQAKETEESRVVKELDILQATIRIYLSHRTKFKECKRTRREEDSLYGTCLTKGSFYSDWIFELRDLMEDEGFFYTGF